MPTHPDAANRTLEHYRAYLECLTFAITRDGVSHVP
jgi:hypothetical protein